MDTHDLTPADASATPSPEKRTYRTPQVIELGDVRELTRGMGASHTDNRSSLKP